MPEQLSRLDLYERGRQYMLAKASKISPEVVDTAGSDANLFVGSTSYMAAAVSAQSTEQMGEHFLDPTMPDASLDRLVFDLYSGMTRKGAAPALATVQLSRVSSAAGAGTVPAGTKILSLTGTEFVTLAPASFGATQLDGVSVDVRSVQAGQQFATGANQITQFSDASLLWDPSLLVNNAIASAGAADRETNEDLVLRARQFFVTARRGVLGAIEFGALAVPGVLSASAIDVIEDSDLRPARVVLLYIADATGTSNAALASLVATSLDEYRAGGISVVIANSTPQIVTVQLALQFAAGVDTMTLASNIRGAVLGFINSLGVNQPLYRNDLGAVLSRFSSQGLISSQGSIAVPAGDVFPDTGRTLRARLDNIVVL